MSSSTSNSPTAAVTYNQALGWAASVLAIKMMINHVLVVRIRISKNLEGKYGNVDKTPESHPTKWYPAALFPIFYAALGCFGGPWLDDDSFERLQAMETNSTENEPYFLALASVWPLAVGGYGALPTWAPAALTTFVYSRLGHFGLYMGKLQPWRAVAYTVGVATNLVISGNILMKMYHAGGGPANE